MLAISSTEATPSRPSSSAIVIFTTRVVKLTTGLLAVLLVVASVLLVSNTIRLSLFSRRREVEVMKLVGATDWFIRWPFVIEGVIVGFMGGVLAVLILAANGVSAAGSGLSLRRFLRV